LVYTAQKYYRLPIRESLDRSKLPNWMNEPFIRMPLDWELLRKEGDEWLKYWDTNIRGRGAK
jgi:iron(III) transport system substrate-binding protein